MASASAKLGDLVGGKYELEKMLGQGAMGAVYRARHRLTGRRVAIKFLLDHDDPSRRRRFMREAQALGRLSHPNVIQVIDVGEEGGAIYLVMELLHGKPLTDFVAEGGIGAAEAIALLMPALSGVAAAHQAGILHRDLKPDNMFVCCDRDGVPYDTKVLDFGLAKADDEERAKLTQSGSIVGTPRYMAPEQLKEEKVDARSDIFALGLILYELLTGRMPYRSKSLNALLIEILTTDHGSPVEHRADLDPKLGDVVQRALSRDPRSALRLGR